MKLALVVLSLACGCFAHPGGLSSGWIGSPAITSYTPSISSYTPSISSYTPSISSYTPSISSYSLTPSITSYSPSISSVSLPAPTISSHTHTHSTAIIDRAVPVAVHTPTITTSSIIPSTYGLSNYGYPLATSYPSISYNKLYPSFNKYYSSYPTTVYKKSYYSSPLIKSYKW
jgi:hypothetical protein